MKVLVWVLSTLTLASAVRLNHHWLSNQMKRNSHGMARGNDSIVNGNFDTPLDHFSPTDNRWVTLNYSMNTNFFKEGGPLFFVFDIIEAYPVQAFQQGLVHNLARELNGAIIISTSRYFVYNELG